MNFTAPTYFQCPNDLADHWLPLLKEAELKVLIAILRKTFGWHKKRDRISNSQLVKMTGLSLDKAIKAAKSLAAKGVIIREKIGEPGKEEIFYELFLVENTSTPLANCYPPPSKLLPTKETNTKDNEKIISKEIIQKKGVTPTASPPEPSGSQSPPSISKKEKEYSEELVELAQEMTDSLKVIKPDAKIGSLNAILQALDALTRLDGRSTQKIKDVFSWALSNSFWQSKLIKPNPAKYLREKFDTLEMQMQEKPNRKNKPTGQRSGDYDNLF